MIIDTSILVEIDRGITEEKIKKIKDNINPKISTITVSELYIGSYKREKTDESSLENLISAFKQIPLNQEIAKKAGELISRKQEKDLGIGINDIYIAATAIQKNEKLLTKDVQDFNEINDLEVLDWNNF